MPDPTIPPALGSVAELGDPVRVYKRGTAARVGELIGCAAGLLCALGLGYWGLVDYSEAYPKVAATNVPFLYGLAGLVLLGTLYWAWHIYSHWGEAAVVCTDGLAHFDGRQVRAVKWTEVDSLSMRVVETRLYGVIPAGTERHYTIVSRTGGKLKLDGKLSKVQDLFEEVRAATFPHLMARSRQRFESGEPVQFGSITISKAQGIQSGKKTYQWSDIAQISVSNGQLHVKPKKRGPFTGLSVPVEYVANLDVFLTIAADMAKQHMPGT